MGCVRFCVGPTTEAKLFMMLAQDGLMSVLLRYQLYGHWPPWSAQSALPRGLGGCSLLQFSMATGRPVASIKLAQRLVLWNWEQPSSFTASWQRARDVLSEGLADCGVNVFPRVEFRCLG